MNQSVRNRRALGRELLGFRVAVFDGYPVVKLTIEAALRRAGAKVAPISDDELDGAVLGLTAQYLSTAGPIADALLRRGVRILFYAGQEEVELAVIKRLWPDAMVIAKPESMSTIIRAVAALLSPWDAGDKSASAESDR